MHDTTAPSPELEAPALPAPIPLRDVWPWALFAAALLALVYLVGLEQGATALTPGSLVHELMHDGRHALGFPCH